MKIGLMSDLHLEFHPLDWTEVRNWVGDQNIDVLCICGDICPVIETTMYETCIAECSRLATNVLVIAGNHEYYGSSIVYGNRLIKNIIARYPNVTFLDKRSVKIGPVIFYGTTLWANIPKDRHGDMMFRMNCYRQISCFTPEVEMEMFRDNYYWLKNQVLRDRSRWGLNSKQVVMTHHLPSFDLISESYRSEELDVAYASEILEDILPDVWMCGHSHSRTDKWYHNLGVRAVMHCRGYGPDFPDNQEPIKIFEL